MNAPTPPKPPTKQDEDKEREQQENARQAEISAEVKAQVKAEEKQASADEKAAKADVKANAPEAPNVAKGAEVALADDVDKIVTGEVPLTAHNSDPSDTKLEDAYSGTLFAVVDPFRKDAKDPFTHDGFVGVDPSQAHVSETRRPDPANDDLKV